MTPSSRQSADTRVSGWPIDAAARPAIVRSRISSRSNSAKAAKIPNTSLPDGVRRQLVDEIDEVPQIAAKPIEFPDNQGVGSAKSFEALVEPRPALGLAGNLVLIEATRLHAGGDERVKLKVERLCR